MGKGFLKCKFKCHPEEAVLAGREWCYFQSEHPITEAKRKIIIKKKAPKFRKAMLSDSADGLFLEKHLPTVKSFFNNPRLRLKIKVSSIHRFAVFLLFLPAGLLALHNRSS